MRVGQQVRVITLRGCMAHERFYGSVQRARVIGFGSFDTRFEGRIDAVELEDMATGAHYWRSRIGWVERHGILEYQV
jgi:hypothetical protein